MTPRDQVRVAARGALLHRTRSALAVAAFASGTAAAVTLSAITTGASAEILRQIRSLGADQIVVRPLTGQASGAPPALTLGDADALRQSFPFLREAAPVRRTEASVLLPDERLAVSVIGTTADYFRLRGVRFERGGVFPAAATGGRLCVLGAAAARSLFGAERAYGSLVKIDSSWYRVVGVLGGDAAAVDAREASLPTGGREVYLPIDDTLSDRSASQPLSELVLRIDGHTDAEAAAAVVERALVRRHDGQKPFEVATRRGAAPPASRRPRPLRRAARGRRRRRLRPRRRGDDGDLVAGSPRAPCRDRHPPRRRRDNAGRSSRSSRSKA